MKNKKLSTLTITCWVITICLLTLFIIAPSSERAYRKQIKKQHYLFFESLINDDQAFAEHQIPVSDEDFIYCKILVDTIGNKRYYRPEIKWDDHSIKMKDRSNGSYKYYTLYEDTEGNRELVKKLGDKISYTKNVDNLIALLPTERKEEIRRIPSNEETNRMLSVITNLLIGNNGFLATYIDDDSLQFVTMNDVCQYYITERELKEWCEKDTTPIDPTKSFHVFLEENNIISKIPYHFVRMNFRDDKLYIGNQVENFNNDNAELQRKCMEYPFVVLASDGTILNWENRNDEIGEKVKWCQTKWYEDSKTKSLERYGIQPIEKKNHDTFRMVLLILFIISAIISVGLLCLYFHLRHNARKSGKEVPDGYGTTGTDGDSRAVEIKKLKEQIKALESEKKSLETENKSLQEKKNKLEEEKQSLIREQNSQKSTNSSLSQDLNDWKKKYSELLQKWNDLVPKFKKLAEDYKSLKANHSALVADTDKKIEDATNEVKQRYEQIEAQYMQILPYYRTTNEIIRHIVPYLQSINKDEDMRFWDRVILQQVAIHEILLPLSKVWCKDIELKSIIEKTLEKMRTDSLQQYLLLYLERTLRYDNISAQEFSQALNEKIPQEIANYNAKVKQLQVPGIIINQNGDKKYTECADLMRLKVSQLKLDESFKTKMWTAFGKEFVDKVDETTDRTWFFKYVIALAYYTAEYLQFNANKSTDTSSYYNLTYLLNGFEPNYPKEYEHNYYGKSNSYADRIYDWCKELGIEHLQVLISEYLILP